MFTRRTAMGIASILLSLFIAGCGAPKAPPAAPAEAEAPGQHCARMAAIPHAIEPAVKLAGEPAELTPEAVQAGVRGPVQVRCSVTTRGTVAFCKLLDEVPASQERIILAKLATWRFRPATYDGRIAALEMTFMVPLVAPPPGWEPPKPPEIKVVPIEFAPEMTAPKLVAGAPGPAYPQKARDMCVEGKAVARCTITEEGELTDCYMVKSLPGVDEAILTALAGRRYTPVLYKGKPQRVFYTFPFTFKLE